MADARPAAERKFLIAAGTSEYRHLDNAGLPGIPGDLDSIAGCFNRLGYRRVLLDCSLNPTADAFKSALGEWFASHDLTPQDKVIFYYSGHGEKEDRHYLLFADSKWKRLDYTALSTEDLIRIMLKHSRIQQALVVIDTCYSGEAILDASAMAGALSRSWDGGADCGVYFFAACRPKEFALDGRFAPNLADVVLNDDSRTGGKTVEYLDPGCVVEVVRQRFREQAIQQHVNWSAVGASGLSRLLANLRYDPRVRPGVDLESQRTLAPGVAPVEVAHGVRFFTGREAARRTIADWLHDPSDTRACVVTGRPGTGKSTLLAHLSSESNGTMRLLPARGRTLADLTYEVARAFGFEAVAAQAHHAIGAEATRAASALVVRFADQQQAVWIAIDGLDESAQPSAIGREFLAGLAAMPHLRLLVASRAEARPDKPGARVPSVGPALEVDLDQAEYADPAAVERFAARVLSEAPAYQGQQELVSKSASAIAGKAGHVFLIARILCNILTHADKPVPLEALPTLSGHVGPAFDEFLDRFDAAPQGGLDRRSVVDLLEPLAWAEGEGLPWEYLWAPLASAVSGRDYSNSDIRVLLERAGAFIVESRSQGHSVYRLYHALLAEHLRDASRTAEVHGRIALRLAELTPDWTQAHPYIRSWLPIHAAKGGQLGRFAEDPLFLACVDPAALATAVGLAAPTLPADVVRLCRGVVLDLLAAQSTNDALSLLELHARQCGADQLAGRIGALPVVRRWSVPWARWSPPAAHRLLARPGGFVYVAASEVGGAPVVITGSEKGVQVIDVRTNAVRQLRARTGPHDIGRKVAAAGPLLAEPRLTGVTVWDLESDWVLAELTAPTAVHVVDIRAAERTYVTAGASSGAVYLWDLDRGAAPVRVLDGHTSEARAVLLSRLAGREIVVSGDKDGIVIVWDVDSGEPINRFVHREPNPHADQWVFSLAVARRNGREAVLASYFGGEIVAWDPLTGERAGKPIESKRKPDFAIYGMRLVEIDGRQALVSAESDGTIRVRDLETGEALRQPTKGHEPHTSAWSLALITEGGRPTAISGGNDGTVRAWDFSTGPATSQDASETPTYNALSIVERDGKAAILAVTKEHIDATVHVIDADTGITIERPFPLHDGWPTQSASVAQIGKRTVVAFGDYQGGEVSALDVKTGRSVGGPWPRGSGSTRVAFSELHGRPVLAVADDARSIRLFEFSKEGTLWTIEGVHGGKSIWALGAGRFDGRPVILSSGFDGMVRVWDVETHAQVSAVEKGDLRVDAIALGPIGARSRIVFGTDQGALHITEVDGATQAIIHVGSKIESVAIAPHSTIIVATGRGLLSIRWHAS